MGPGVQRGPTVLKLKLGQITAGSLIWGWMLPRGSKLSRLLGAPPAAVA